MIRKFLPFIALILAMFTLPALAQTINTDGLTADQIKTIQAQINQVKTTASDAGLLDLKSVAEYVEVGKGVGAGIAAAAKELGMAVAEFASTGVGQIAVAILLYKVVGADILSGTVSLLVAAAWTIFVFRTWKHYFQKICLVESTTETVAPDGTRTIVTQGFDHDDGNIAGYRFVMFLVLFVSLIPGFIVYAHS